ncbi:MAG: hypothetical protein KGV44_07385 [Flavobacteriaceae bacterium]|nr:hypothetical protein [Flavobacteriaceae bacterium]
MKYKLAILFSVILLISCKNQEKKKMESKEPTSELSNCEKYWKSFPNDTTKVKYINDIISKNQLTANNLRFLNALKNQKKEQFAFENVLTPIFRLSNTKIGLFTFPEYKKVGENEFITASKEMELIEKFDTISKNTTEEHYEKIKFYPTILDNIFKNRSKPTIYYYTTNKIDSTKIKELGIHIDECVEYCKYSIDTTHISKNDKVLFGSPYKIDLVFENNKKIDSLIKLSVKEECYDCPSSTKFQQTFARVKGTKNLYFTYADTFPINDQLDTPLRSLIFITSENEIVYLWYKDIDLFGCSCV